MRKRLRLPPVLQRTLDAFADGLLQEPGAPPVDFAAPPGEPALASPDSVSWRVFRNPVALFVGGVAAVLLEFAEPRVRTGVWVHSSFRSRPVERLRRTGLAAMVTVYGARSVAARMIAGVVRRHEVVRGTMPGGKPYAAADPALLDWVQATAAFGFAHAYHAYVRPLSPDEFDAFYLEGRPAARLYGATGAPASTREMEALFEAMAPRLEASPIVHEFLHLMATSPILPAPLRPFQRLLVRAATEVVPSWVRERLGLTVRHGLRGFEKRLVGLAARTADRIVLQRSPAVQSCRRLGLPDDYLLRPPGAGPL